MYLLCNTTCICIIVHHYSFTFVFLGDFFFLVVKFIITPNYFLCSVFEIIYYLLNILVFNPNNCAYACTKTNNTIQITIRE